jgi:hypothetical protein
MQGVCREFSSIGGPRNTTKHFSDSISARDVQPTAEAGCVPDVADHGVQHERRSLWRANEAARDAQARLSYSVARPHPRDETVSPTYSLRTTLQQESVMGKYLIGWILGVPVFVLVIAYLFFH